MDILFKNVEGYYIANMEEVAHNGNIKIEKHAYVVPKLENIFSLEKVIIISITNDDPKIWGHGKNNINYERKFYGCNLKRFEKITGNDNDNISDKIM